MEFNVGAWLGKLKGLFSDKAVDFTRDLPSSRALPGTPAAGTSKKDFDEAQERDALIGMLGAALNDKHIPTILEHLADLTDSYSGDTNIRQVVQATLADMSYWAPAYELMSAIDAVCENNHDDETLDDLCDQFTINALKGLEKTDPLYAMVVSTNILTDEDSSESLIEQTTGVIARLTENPQPLHIDELMSLLSDNYEYLPADGIEEEAAEDGIIRLAKHIETSLPLLAFRGYNFVYEVIDEDDDRNDLLCEKIVALSEQLLGSYDEEITEALTLVCENTEEDSDIGQKAHDLLARADGSAETKDYSEAAPLTAQAFTMKFGIGPRP